jgi:hypothetical protein
VKGGWLTSREGEVAEGEMQGAADVANGIELSQLEEAKDQNLIISPEGIFPGRTL